MLTSVVVVDAQNDFMREKGALPVPGAESVIGEINAHLSGLDPATTRSVLFTFDTHYAETYAESEEAKQFPLHCDYLSWGWLLAVDPSVIPSGIATGFLRKQVFDMWQEPGLELDFRQHGAIDRDRYFDGMTGAPITLLGVASDYCVRFAFEGFAKRGFRVQVPRGCTAGIEQSIEDACPGIEVF